MMGFRHFYVWLSGEGTALCLLDLQSVAVRELHWFLVWWDFGLEVCFCSFLHLFFPFFFFFKFHFPWRPASSSFFPAVFFACFFSVVHRAGLLFPTMLLQLQSCLHTSLYHPSLTSVNFCIWWSTSTVECLILVHLQTLLTYQGWKNCSIDNKIRGSAQPCALI